MNRIIVPLPQNWNGKIHQYSPVTADKYHFGIGQDEFHISTCDVTRMPCNAMAILPSQMPQDEQHTFRAIQSPAMNIMGNADDL